MGMRSAPVSRSRPSIPYAKSHAGYTRTSANMTFELQSQIKFTSYKPPDTVCLWHSVSTSVANWYAEAPNALAYQSIPDLRSSLHACIDNTIKIARATTSGTRHRIRSTTSLANMPIFSTSQHSPIATSATTRISLDAGGTSICNPRQRARMLRATPAERRPIITPRIDTIAESARTPQRSSRVMIHADSPHSGHSGGTVRPLQSYPQ